MKLLRKLFGSNDLIKINTEIKESLIRNEDLTKKLIDLQTAYNKAYHIR